MWRVVREFHRAEEAFAITTPRKFFGRYQKVLAASSGLHSEPGKEPEEGHAAQLLQLWEVLESIWEPRTFWYKATDHLTSGLLHVEPRPDDGWAAAFYLSWA